MKNYFTSIIALTMLSACDEPVQVVNAPKDTLEVVDVAKEERHAKLQAKHINDSQVDCEGSALCEEIRALARGEVDKTQCKGDEKCLEDLVFNKDKETKQ